MKLHLSGTGCHLPYGITQCYLPSDTSETLRFNPGQTGRYSIYLSLGGMEGSVDLGDWLHTEMVYPFADGHPSKY